MTFLNKSGPLLEAEMSTEAFGEGQSIPVTQERLHELQEANSRLRLLVSELLRKNQELRVERTNEQIAPLGRNDET